MSPSVKPHPTKDLPTEKAVIGEQTGVGIQLRVTSRTTAQQNRTGSAEQIRTVCERLEDSVFRQSVSRTILGLVGKTLAELASRW